MPIQCRMIDPDDPSDAIGDMYFVPALQIHKKIGDDGKLRYFSHGYQLSTEYVQERMSSRLPLMVKVPGLEGRGIWFLLDSALTGEDRGWTVTGTPPNISVSPSIKLGTDGHLWHGWLQNGILTGPGT